MKKALALTLALAMGLLISNITMAQDKDQIKLFAPQVLDNNLERVVSDFEQKVAPKTQTEQRLLLQPEDQELSQRYLAPHLRPMPPRCTTPPRLGFTGRFVYGYGMEVVQTEWGSIAERVGLERGDVIVAINGRSIRSLSDYRNALLDAVNYRGGHANLTVRDVRSPYTCSRALVTVHVDLPCRDRVIPAGTPLVGG